MRQVTEYDGLVDLISSHVFFDTTGITYNGTIKSVALVAGSVLRIAIGNCVQFNIHENSMIILGNCELVLTIRTRWDQPAINLSVYPQGTGKNPVYVFGISEAKIEDHSTL